MTYHVLVPDSVHPSAVEILEAAGLKVSAPGQMKRPETLAAIADADALIIRSATKADAELLNAAPKLKAIARAGVGVDNVDLNVATQKGIAVMNTPDGNSVATAELAFSLMLSLARAIPQAHASMQAGKWDRKTFMGTELRGKTLGVVGFGRIGRAVAKRAQAFEMQVIAHDPYIPLDIAEDFGVKLVSLDELYAQADYITLHTIVNNETRHLINKDTLARMKKGVRIINAARGALINDADLAEALKSGQVAGAALDVYAEEPPPADHPLVGLPNVIDTPHLGASTEEAQVAVAVEAAQLIVAALTRSEYKNVVNTDVLKR
ncbi:MAG TPA: hydroxyacid dehydrogenase [Phototrophicaceae bacterium]|nr:hydroxyacid dehydrogenase [Phototrophicaceae bacterium]